MKRREFIVGFGSAAAWPLKARAQQGERVRRIGVLLPEENDAEGKLRLSAFTQALEALGWTDGRNVRIDLGAAVTPIRCEGLRRSWSACNPTSS